MWMMGCNDGGGFNNSDSFNGRKLRPLIPRPCPTTTSNGSITPSNTNNNIPISSNPPCLSRLHGADLFLFNNHLATVTEQSKGELMGISATTTTTTTTTVVSSRWNPTPEQLRTLEELYRRGTRTPTAEQIQHITAQLRRYGKIEGKNVFYWFQNHKARERQKRRRKSSESGTNTTTNAVEKYQQRHETHDHISLLERNESGGSSRTGYEVEQTKNWPLPTKCSTLAKEAVSMQGAAVVAAAESRTDGWFQFEDEANFLHTRSNSSSRLHATWQMMNLSSSSSPLINTTTLEISTTDTPKLPNTQNLNILFAPKITHSHIDVQESDQDSHTLELFPLRKDDVGTGTRNGGIIITEKEKEHLPNTPIIHTTTPYQFFKFL